MFIDAVVLLVVLHAVHALVLQLLLLQRVLHLRVITAAAVWRYLTCIVCLVVDRLYVCGVALLNAHTASLQGHTAAWCVSWAVITYVKAVWQLAVLCSTLCVCYHMLLLLYVAVLY